MKNQDLIVLLQALNGIKNSVENSMKKDINKNVSVKFVYAVNKNIRILSNNAKVIQESLAMLKDIKDLELIKEFEDKRSKIGEKYAEKDKEGNPRVLKGIYQIPEVSGAEAKKELEKLEVSKKFKDILKKQNVLNEKNKELLEAEVDEDTKLHMIKLDNIPSIITPVQQDSIFEIIEE